MLDRPLDETPDLHRPLQAWYGGGWIWEEPRPDPVDPNQLGPLDLPPIGPEPIEQGDFGGEQRNGQGHGLVPGRFLPPHRGHLFLLDFARAFVERLTVVVRAEEGDPIPIDLRLGWLRELCPTANIFAVTLTEPPDSVALAAHHAEILRTQITDPIHFVFGSEREYASLADSLEAEFVPVDPKRSALPISASQIRADPLGHWGWLPPCVRPYYVRRVCLLGPEGTGKTTLAGQLAHHYGTVVVPEYARILLSDAGRRWRPEDVQRIARGQLAAESALARQANRLLFCDTDVLGIALWSERLFGTCPDWLRQEAGHPNQDLYLVTDCDVPFHGDPSRDEPQRRQAFLDRCLAELATRHRPHVRIRGTWEERFERARQVVDDLLGVPSEV